jgi:hypothetical protein
MDPDGTFRTYEKRLGPLPPIRRRQLLEGDWSAVTGQFFKAFRNEPGHWASHVQRVEVPRGTKYFRCLDWGHQKPGVCYWIARLPDGHLYVHQEYKFIELTVAAVARRIVQLTRELDRQVPGGVQCSYTVVDPAMGNKTGSVGESMMETLTRHGVPCQRADNERVLGWQRFQHWLELAPDGRPWLLIDPRCPYLVESLPTLVSDRHDADDVDTEGDDHGADAIRYGLMSRPLPTRASGREQYPPGSFGWWHQWMQRRERGLH